MGGSVTATSRTYSLLGSQAASPSEYEIVTSRLSPHAEHGFEVAVPLASWYAQYGAGSRLRCASWESFRDPRETTYTMYTRQRADRERELDELLETARTSSDQAWTARTNMNLSALRFPLHGFHMIAAYIAHMAPSGRITMAAMFQAADQLRSIERFAQQLWFTSGDDHDAEGRQAWQHAKAWQPLRETVERLLVTYDWGEAFVGFSLCVAPMLDDLITAQWARAASSSGDRRLAAILASLEHDRRWHRSWSAELVRIVLADTPSSRVPITEWIDRWSPRARGSVRALAPMFGGDAALTAIEANQVAQLADMNLKEGGP
jgi:toluene monooxygenase system protein E